MNVASQNIHANVLRLFFHIYFSWIGPQMFLCLWQPSNYTFLLFRKYRISSVTLASAYSSSKSVLTWTIWNLLPVFTICFRETWRNVCTIYRVWIFNNSVYGSCYIIQLHLKFGSEEVFIISNIDILKWII